MEKQSTTLSVLTTEVTQYLGKLSYSDSRISQYRSAWQRVKVFMESNQLEYYSSTVGEAFIYNLIGDRIYDDLDRWEKDIIQCANVLTEFQETGSIKFRRCKKFRDLPGAIGQTMTRYINHRKTYGLQEGTIDQYKQHFQQFLRYLNENEIHNLEDLDQQCIVNYITQFAFSTDYTRNTSISILKGYLKYLFDQELMVIDYSRVMPRAKRVKQPKLPSTYSKEEVESLIASIDRSSPKGKRDYAIVLLAARLGLRAIDVCMLNFENIKWEQNLIILIQKKTNREIELPLLSEIGEAIIDYLKYSRPSSELPYVFLQVNSPYDRLNRSTIHSIVSFYLRRAGIQYKDERKHGPHALRHSLAGILLEKHTPLPVISEVLGHQNTESTKYYLRIDINTLRQCALEVPLFTTSFYEGGSK